MGFFVQALLYDKLCYQEEGEEGPVFSQEMQCRFRPSDKFRALATGTLGKMCLQV